MARRRIALVGAGNIGGALASIFVSKDLGDIVLYDVVEGLAEGKALDLNHSAPIFESSVRVKGTSDIAEIEGAAVTIISAGIARRPGMSRDDLLRTNAGIMEAVSRELARHAPDSFVIVISNPLDAMVTHCCNVTGFCPQRVVGMAGVLDTARYRFFIAEALDVSAASVSALVLGGHGDAMVPVRSATAVGGIAVSRLLSEEKLEAIENRVRGAGGEVVSLLKTGSAFCSPAAAAALMAESYLLDQKRVLPCSAYVDGQYGCSGLYLGVPAVIGAGGVERIVEVPLTERERSLLDESARGVRELTAELPR